MVLPAPMNSGSEFFNYKSNFSITLFVLLTLIIILYLPTWDAKVEFLTVEFSKIANYGRNWQQIV